MFNTTFCSSKEEEGKHAASVDTIQKMFCCAFFSRPWASCSSTAVSGTPKKLLSLRGDGPVLYVIPDLKSM